MKKFISLMLAGLLSASLFAFGVSAEKEIGGADGVGDFTHEGTGSNINVKVEDVTHMYAVDITFSFGDLTLGNLVWNVNTMRYDFADGADLDDTSRSITVSNRSDLPVQAYATVATTGNGIDKAPGLTVAMTGAGNAEDNKMTVAKATAGTTAKGTATEGTLTVSLTSEDWNAVGLYYTNKQLQANSDTAQTFKVATVTVYISKAA